MATCGTLVVRPQFSAQNVTVASCTGGADVRQGETVPVTATVENTNDDAANVTVTLYVDGSPTGSTSLAVPANASSSVTFSLDTGSLEPGDHSVDAEAANASRA